MRMYIKRISKFYFIGLVQIGWGNGEVHLIITSIVPLLTHMHRVRVFATLALQVAWKWLMIKTLYLLLYFQTLSQGISMHNFSIKLHWGQLWSCKQLYSPELPWSSLVFLLFSWWTRHITTLRSNLMLSKALLRGATWNCYKYTSAHCNMAPMLSIGANNLVSPFMGTFRRQQFALQFFIQRLMVKLFLWCLH